MPLRSAGLAMAGALLFAVAACGGQHNPAPTTSASPSVSASVAPPEPKYSTTPVIAKPAIVTNSEITR